MKIKKYRNFEIHYVTGTNAVEPQWKYDIYHQGLYFSSVNTLKEAREFITAVLWTRRHIPS